MDIMEEIQKLKKENDYLKEKLAEFGYFCESDQILNKADKIAIFRDYFKGRDDVYAKSYYDKRKGKIAYTVACQNEGNQDCWNRKHICKECPFKKKQALTDFVLELHFKESNKAIGLYPLMDNNTCYLLAMDFDGNNWFEDMKYVYRIAKSFHIVPLMEKSRSGDGGHLWFFFENPIKAVQARNFGNCLLGEAMRISRSLKFAAFDRMFPSQDYINESGIGNCIALPLSKDAFSRKNSVFINENGEYIPNQIQYKGKRWIYRCSENNVQR